MNDLMQKTGWNFRTSAWADEQKLPGFGELLNSWLQVHKKFCTGLRPETSWEWDYKERSQIGFLSNAGVLIGGITLEEWSISKKSGDGRNDLWLRLPRQTLDYYIEAKWGGIDLEWPENNVVEKLSEVMGNAIKDAEQLIPKNENEKAVAVSFFILLYNNMNADDLDKKTSALLNFIQEKQSQHLGLNAVSSIYFSAEDFQKNRLERKENLATWTNNIAGLIFMAKLVDVT